MAPHPEVPVLLTALLSLVACDPTATPDKAEADDTAVAGDVPTWHQDVAPIYARSCAGCHAPGGGGQPVWEDVDDVLPWASVIGTVVGDRTMPPWRAAPGCNAYAGDFSLTDAELDAVVRWAEGGTPMGDPATAAALPEPFEAESLDRVDVSLQMAEPYTPRTADTDDYRCFLMEWPLEERVRVNGYEVLPGNLDVVHHVIAFLMPPDAADDYRALDAADPEPGYTCFGGPGGDIQSLIDARWLGAWAPGSGATTLPPDTGIRVDPGSLVVFQVHYNTAGAVGPDRSGLALRVDPDASSWADLQPWTDVSWVLGVGMDIPARSEGVTHTFEYTVSERDSAFRFFTVAPHMHRLGRSLRMEVEHPDGSKDCLLDEPAYDFNWQRTYRFLEPVQAVTGDVVRLTCTWDNPTDADVRWGDGTGDEMCLGITLLAQ